MQLCAPKVLQASGMAARGGTRCPAPRRCLRGGARPWIVPRAAREGPTGDIDYGPRGASRSFQDMKNAQESYLDEEEGGGGPAKPASAAEKGASAGQPDEGTVKQAEAYNKGGVQPPAGCEEGYPGDMREGGGHPDKSVKGA